MCAQSTGSTFRWAEIDVIAKKKLSELELALRKEVTDHLRPFPKSMADQRRFLLMLADEARDWVERGEEAYGLCLAEIGRDWTHDVTHLIWNYGLSDFIGGQVRDLLLLSCGMDDEKRKLLSFRPYKNYPTPDNVVDARVRAHEVGRIVENLKKAWDAKLSQRTESNQTSWLFQSQKLLHEIDPRKHPLPPRLNLAKTLTLDQPTGPIESPSQPGQAEAPAPDNSKVELLLKRMESAKDHVTFRTAEAALVLNVSTETVNRWVRANKLTPGSKRGTILISSIRRKLGTIKNPG